MNEMSTAELLELRFMLEASIDVQFQVWMAITFAVVVASYSGRAEMTTAIRIVVVFVYLMATCALLGRWITEALRIGQLVEVLNERGAAIPYVTGAGYLRFATYFFGTIISAISVFYFARQADRDEISAPED